MPGWVKGHRTFQQHHVRARLRVILPGTNLWNDIDELKFNRLHQSKICRISPTYRRDDFAVNVLDTPAFACIGNGQPSEAALCQLYRHTFVPYLALPHSLPLCLPVALSGWLRVEYGPYSTRCVSRVASVTCIFFHEITFALCDYRWTYCAITL